MGIKEAIDVIEAMKDYMPCEAVETSALDTAIEALEKQIPLKVIKTNTVSQACQVCKFSVNWNHCPECGQKLEY